MPRYRVTHIVLCEVACYRTIQAENPQELKAKLESIETYTCDDDSMSVDTEIISDREVISVDIREIK
jgi:hypothetical protein